MRFWPVPEKTKHQRAAEDLLRLLHEKTKHQNITNPHNNSVSPTYPNKMKKKKKKKPGKHVLPFGLPENRTSWVTGEQDSLGRRRTGRFGSRVGRRRSLARVREIDAMEGMRERCDRG
jgi:hypothetical protein